MRYSLLPTFSMTLAVLLSTAGCTKSPTQTTHILRGEVTGFEPERGRVIITHEAVDGVMGEMTMPFSVSDSSLLRTLRVGDSLTARLVMSGADSYLDSVRILRRDTITQRGGDIR